MPEYRDPFPDGIDLPGDPNVPLTPEQLAALFPSRVANQRFINVLQRGIQQHTQPSTPAHATVGAANNGA